MSAARLLALVAGLLCAGCQGESVVEAKPDSSATPGDAAEDASAGDAAADAAGCMLAGNVLVNGDFAMGTSGWAPSSTKTEPIDGPCGGKGTRLYEATGYGSIGQTLDLALKRGTRVRLRAYFRDLPGTKTPPALMLRFRHLADGGEVTTQEAGIVAGSGTAWSPVETSAVLERDEERVDAILASRTAERDEFAVAAVSLVIEPPK